GDPANASALPLSTRTEGRLDSTYADVDWWRLSVPGAGLLRLAVSDCCGGPIAGALLNATDLAPTAAVGVYTGPGLGGLSLVVDGPTDFYFVAQELYYAAHTYTMNATFEAGFAHLQGPDEIEPNDRIQDALALAQGVAVRGLAEGTFGDHDFWSIALAGGGYGFLNLVSDAVWCSVEVTDAGGKPLASSSSYGDPISLNFAVPPAGPAYIDVSSVSGPCAYSLDAKWGLSQSIVSEGAGEREPNDAAEQGTVISATGSYAGRLKPTYDTVDFFRVEPVSGAVVRVEVSAPAGFGAPPRFAWVDGAGLARSAWSGPRDLPYRTDLLLHPGEPFVFSIALGGWDSDYLLNVTVTPTDIFADGSANLAELASLAIGFHIESLGSGGSPGENFTFAAGERSSYGLWLCGRSSLDNTVPGVLVERGRLLIPEGPGPTMVARAEGEGEVTGEFGPCFEVLARDTQELGLASWVYAVGGFLEGDALKVLAAAEGSFQSQGSVLLALWAVTSIPTLAELEAWEVEPLAVDAANGLLERAGVTQRLPIPRAPVEQPPPPPPGNITVAARTPLGLSGAIALGALAGGGTAAALIAGAVANSRLSRPTAPAEAPRCGQCGRPARPGFVSCPECRAPYRWR
ncbi:MAG TPA: hypothetical protein VJN41_04515, partial [Alphaproteobacteria bacterium]|nr:hypothetical protein [Alphaproteobacteria bacterium]